MIRRPLIISLLVLLVTFLAFERSSVDLHLQDQFYRPETKTWCVNAYAPVPRLVFYLLPKALIWTIGLVVLAAAVAPQRFRSRIPLIGHLPRRQLIATVTVIAMCPLTVSVGKMLTNVHTPAELTRYGGTAHYLKVIEPVPPEARHLKRGLGFPAGHASGGFSLIGLSLLAERRRIQRWLIASSITLGWIMGIYQMLKGVHFLSHTVISMLLCWVILESTKAVLGSKPVTMG